MQGVCGGLLGEGPVVALALNYTCSIKKGTYRAQGGRVWCKLLKPQLYILWPLLKSFYADGRGKKWYLPALVSRQGSSCTTVREALTGEQTISSLSTSVQASSGSCVLSQACSWVFKAPNFRNLALINWGEGLTELWLVLVCPRKAVVQQCRGLEFMVKCSRKPTSRLAAFSSISARMLMNRAAKWHLRLCSFVP